MRIIAGTARGTTIYAPEGKDTRPTLDRVRENLFNMLQGEVADRRVLDLFAGSGALSLEAVSRGAREAVLVDRDPRAIDVQIRNIRKLRFEQKCRTLRCDWSRALKQLKAEKASFDLVFLDPPYAMTDLRDVFHELSPLLSPEAMVILEHQAGKEPETGAEFELLRSRSWGYCCISFYRRNEPNPGGTEQ